MMDTTARPANVWLGAETGLLKSVNLIKKVATNYFYKENYGKEHEICAMCWEHQSKNMLYTGHKNGIVRQFDFNSNNFINSYQIPDIAIDKERIIGLYKMEDSFLSVTSNGNVKLWNMDTLNVPVSIRAGDNITSMAFNNVDKLFACGGKENLLKLWDLTSSNEPIFKAKNVRPDWLQLRVPVWIIKVKFLEDSQKILTTTGTHHIRVYDPKSPTRRPVMETEYSEYPITAAATVQRKPNQVIIGNTRGEVAAFDLRKFKHVTRCYKGFAGSIRDIVCHAELPYFFSCGLDRHLRVHHEDNKKVEHKVYLKSQLNCILTTDDPIEESATVPVSQKRKLDLQEDTEGDCEDAMWKEMDKIEDGNSDFDSESSDEDEVIYKNKPINNKSVKNKKKRKL